MALVSTTDYSNVIEGDISTLESEKTWSSHGSTTKISYSFPWFNGSSAFFDSVYSYEDEPRAAVHFGVTPEIAAKFDAIFADFSDVANIEFTKINEANTDVGDIRVGFSSAVSDKSSNIWGWAYYPGTFPASGDIWINPNYVDGDWDPCSFNYFASMHEVGHALGLSHSFSDLETLATDRDNTVYTIMSYTSYAKDTYSYWDADKKIWVYETVSPETPMLLDIATLQDKYGANTAYNADDTTYTIDPTTPFFKTIWDGGGIDVIDASGFTLSTQINLNDGTYSNMGFAVTNESLSLNAAYDGTRALSIAFNAVIENAIGGTASDILIGNEVQNTLNGLQGDDTLSGGDGNDKLTDSWGIDQFMGDAGNDFITMYFGDDEVDAGAGNDTVWGGRGDDTIDGGDGNDKLAGDTDIRFSQSDDRLIGGQGDDILQGGYGADVFVFRPIDVGHDKIQRIETGTQDFELGRDHIDISAFADISADNYFDYLSQNNDGDAVLQIDQMSVEITGVSMAELSADDFIFV